MCANSNCGFGTQIESALSVMGYTYDRIFVISDMQVFSNNYYYYENPIKKWNRRFNDTMTYSFDLANYSGQIAPPSNNFMFLTSMNDIIFKYLNLVEGKENIVNLINNISF